MRVLTILVCALSAGVAFGSEDWPQFRGPTGQGHASSADAPLTWSESENVVWKTALPGRGWSSPVIGDGQIWLTTALEERLSEENRTAQLEGHRYADVMNVVASLSLRAIQVDQETGEVIRDIPIFEVDDPGPIHSLNSYASPTPVLDAGRLYCDFGTYGTSCLEVPSGEVLWRTKFMIHHSVGPGSSPIVHGEQIILVCDGTERQCVRALDKHTGDTVWTSDRPPIEADDPELRKAFSTALAINHEEVEQLVIPGPQWFVSYEPATGQTLWQVHNREGFSGASRPVYGAGIVYLCTGFPVSELWAIRVDGRGDCTESHVLWTSNKQIPVRSSPILVGNEIYVVSTAGVATCFDAQTGDTRWKSRLGGNFSASPIYAGGRIYFFSEEGLTTVVEPGTDYVELAKNQLDGRIMATPAVVGDAMYVRTDENLYRIE